MNYSRQREAILSCLAKRCDHPTADMVFESVRQDFPKISLGTVYRNLTLLCETGDIMKVATVKGFDRFDYITKPHCHFICSECTRVTDVEADMENLINKKELKNIPGIIDRTDILVYGLCHECSDNRTPND
ncbi:MAG: transcriptional repressor [Treponema sp.]|nr:transcriptional repressor [Treponema sp.]